MLLSIPTILDDYYEEIEQDINKTGNQQILEDCCYILDELAVGEWYGDYTKSEIKALKCFKTKLKNNINTTIVINR